MDITLQLRTFDLISKFLRQDMVGIPHYGYSVQKQPFPLEKTDKSTHFERCAPESCGVSSLHINNFLELISENEQKFNVHGLMVLRHGKVISEHFFAPYLPHVPHMLYSMSKTFTGTAVGMLTEEGLLSLDEKIVNIFPEYNIKPSSIFQSPVKDITVRHLLTMSSGSRFNESGTLIDSNWIKTFMESALKFESGTNFNYNSLNTYMLAAIIKKRSGISLTEYLKTRLFEPLGIGNYDWEKCPMGIEKGGWGLSLTLEDTAKLGQLYLNNGMWEGKRLLSEEFIKNATSLQIATPESRNKAGYGYQIWIGEKHGSYMFNGAFGQYVIVIPKYDTVISIFSGNTVLFSQGDLFSHIYSLVEKFEDSPLPENAENHQALINHEKKLRVLNGFGLNKTKNFRSYECDSVVAVSEFEVFSEAVVGKEFRLAKKTGSLFPMTLQTVHGNFSSGVDTVTFKKGIGTLLISFYETMERNTLAVKANGDFTYSRITHKDEKQIVGTRGIWSDDGKTLFIICSFIETPNTRIIKISLKDDGSINILFDERPTLDGSFNMFLNLIGISERAFFKGLMKTAGKDTNVSAAVRSFTMPSSIAKPIKYNEE